MKTKFDIFLNESMKTNKVVSFSDDVIRVQAEAGEKMVAILKDNLVGRVVAFKTRNFLNENFKSVVITSHSAIMKITDVTYRPESKSLDGKPYFVKSEDRKHYSWYEINPSDRFFYIDTFVKEFKKKYFGKEIIFTGSKRADDLSMFNFGNKNMKVKCVPTQIVIVHDAIHQGDLMKIYTDKEKEFYFIDYKKEIKLAGVINPFDPYGEEEWDND